jgi:acyl-CoA synthetase (AMP-forming)/AMP-acid ligase II
VLPFANLIAALEAAPAEKEFVTFWIDEDERESVTFGEFRRRAWIAAESLRQRGLNSGDRVVIIMPQGIAAMTAFVAAMMLGAVPAFLAYPNFKIEPSKYRSGLVGVTANLGARAVVIDKEFPDEMLGCVSMGQETRLIRAEATNTGKGSALPTCSPGISPDNLAFIQHSAGTTGLQKGVALAHAAVLRQIESLVDALQIDPGADRIYSWLPLYHDMGLIACFMLPLVCHVPIVMQSPLDWVMHPETMLQIMSDCKCTLAWMPNFAFQFVARRTPQARSHQHDLSSLRLLINCSEPVRSTSMSEFQKAFGVKPSVLQSSYAMAENVFAVTQSDIASTPSSIWADAQPFRTAHRIVSVPESTAGALSFASSGRLLPNQKIRIFSDAGEALGDESVGEIAIQGDCLFSGYYNRPDLTAAVMHDGWYHTGDLGFVHAGELYVVGRKKDLLIIGGENIYPQDIEEIVSAHPAIHDGRAVAMGVYNPDLGTEDVVVVAEVESERLLENADELEPEIRRSITASLGIAVRTILLKPPKWIVKSTAGKPARSATREKLLKEHPELDREGSQTP